MVQACSQKWPDRQSWTKYFRNMVQPSRHGCLRMSPGPSPGRRRPFRRRRRLSWSSVWRPVPPIRCSNSQLPLARRLPVAACPEVVHIY
uniref:Uncharacterized protein n=1 Tax=Setaria viridis TaxID=4556 RepID=A0A4U6V5K7_SETVI|nr:hypothetical protein SEVIR_4G248700v2 [Setaria viridis]TKW22753.1 hypothetical protein SEVIR_4G248700v2 [Setaria viridis]